MREQNDVPRRARSIKKWNQTGFNMVIDALCAFENGWRLTRIDWAVKIYPHDHGLSCKVYRLVIKLKIWKHCGSLF
jgi:hypothetical protein